MRPARGPLLHWREGKHEFVDPFSGEEEYYYFPPPLDVRGKVFNHIHEEPMTIPLYIGKQILEQVGVKLHSPKALELLRSNGAKIDRDSGVARISEEMVDAALKSAPNSFVLGA
jgi:hypothetical protein